MADYLPAHTDVLVAVGTFWVSEFILCPSSPSDNCEYVLRHMASEDL